MAPAKNLECGIAAIDHGADAVYIGAPHYGARAAAGNSIADISELCRYAHVFQAKVYVTVNTIIYDNELEDTRRLLIDLQQVGVDAILVQDMGVMRMARELEVKIHASTQTDNRSAEKVEWLRDMGFSRVVLARELSIDEIRTIHEAVPDVELEVFVHGALCVSYSGQCYASQHCMGRSANRGECAQMCRMKYDLVDVDGHVIEHDRYLLSLKDMCQIDNLESLAVAGATSFKIEGRLKDVAYVKNVTAAYSERLNQLISRHPDRYCRTSVGYCRYTFTPNLNKTFNRGYTTFFANGRRPDITSFDTPKAMGEFVGTVKELRRDSFNVAGTARFANGDGLCFLTTNTHHPSLTTLQGFRINRVEGNRLFPQQMPKELRPGMKLYRNSDQEFDRQLSKRSAERKIPITMELQPFGDVGSVDSGFHLTVTCHPSRTPQHVARIQAELQRAQTPQRDNIVRQLSKLGGTPYECIAVNLSDGFDYFIPASRLSELRRQAVTLLSQTTLHAAVHTGSPADSVGGDPQAHPSSSPQNNHKLQTSNFKLQTSKVIINFKLQISNFKDYPQPHLYNIANRVARDFYGFPDLTAYELRPSAGAMLMQCRHCLRYSLGFCVKHGGQRPAWHEPLFLRLGDGRRFRLEFDCRQCQMNVYAADGQNSK